ncbi:MAG TPA: GTP cyclohydrolase II [Polyangiaceae bacterium]|jgi:GTP cyclohydrolase II
MKTHVPPRVIRPSTFRAPVASSTLPTAFGTFDAHVFRSVANHDGGERGEKEHVALVHGDVRGAREAPVRVHSECLTGEAFGSLKCDCKEQLDFALAECVRRGRGIVLYLRQEGRGIGLANKIRAYELQSRGADTVDANRMLGLPDDARRYDVAAEMLDWLGVASVRLMTNNPAKVSALRDLGVEVTGRIPVVVPSNPLAASYLDTKRRRMAHDVPELGLKRTGSDAE